MYPAHALFASSGDSKSTLMMLATIVVLAIGAQWMAWRLRVPAILLLLTVGLLAGPVTGFLPASIFDSELLFPLVSLAVALILFEGGMTLHLSELHESGAIIRNLCTIGALVTFALTTAAAYLLLRTGFAVSLILGSLLVVTGPTVVGPLLRHIRPTGRVGAIAKWEGIVIDPIGAMFAVLALASVEAVALGSGGATRAIAIGLVQTIFWGGLIGLIGAWATVQFLRRYWVPDHLQSPVLLMIVVACFTVANALQDEAGLLAVTLLGVVLGNQKVVQVGHIVEFKENLRVLLISLLFVILAARIPANTLNDLGWGSLAFVAVLILAVRPIAVYLSTLGSSVTWTERAFLAWMAPRGIVAAALASVFALRLEALRKAEGGVNWILEDDAAKLTAVTFLVIIVTVAVYGLTAAPLARRLGLASANPQGILIASAHAGARAIAIALKDTGFRVLLVDSNHYNVQNARMEGLATFYGSILSEPALEELDLGGIGRFLAMTHNDEVNTLAAWHFSEIFGRAEIYQLTPTGEGQSRTETSGGLVRGRRLFGQHANCDYLDERFAHGAVVKKTGLTEEFDLEAFRNLYSESALILFVISSNGIITVNTVDKPVTPKPGDTIIALVDPIREPEGEAESSEGAFNS